VSMLSDASSPGRHSTVGGAPFEMDIHSVAQLIKVWFRELPSSVLLSIPVEAMMGCENELAVLAAFRDIPEPQASLLVYLLDLLANVAMRHAQNRMNAKNLAIVFGPNLLVSKVSTIAAQLQHAAHHCALDLEPFLPLHDVRSNHTCLFAYFSWLLHRRMMEINQPCRSW
jgi:hypothetical protein